MQTLLSKSTSRFFHKVASSPPFPVEEQDQPVPEFKEEYAILSLLPAPNRKKRIELLSLWKQKWGSVCVTQPESTAEHIVTIGN